MALNVCILTTSSLVNLPFLNANGWLLLSAPVGGFEFPKLFLSLGKALPRDVPRDLVIFLGRPEHYY